LPLGLTGGSVNLDGAHAATASGALGPLTPKNVVYQVITDCFVDGDTANNKPAGFDPTLFDDPDGNNIGNGADLKLYQGGGRTARYVPRARQHTQSSRRPRDPLTPHQARADEERQRQARTGSATRGDLWRMSTRPDSRAPFVRQ